MMDFIKKIFQKEEEPQEKQLINLQLAELEAWLNERSKPLMEEAMQHAKDIFMKVDEELQRTRFNIEVLENASLQNPNIPFKAKQYMEGNRKAYIKAINSFLGRMEVNNRDYYYLLEFCKEFEKLIEELNTGTLRSYMILQEFFANESGKIAKNLKNFDLLFKELKMELSNEKLVLVKKLVEQAQLLNSKAKQGLNLRLDVKNASAGLEIAEREKNGILAEIERFSKSQEHENFLKLSEEKKSKMSSSYSDEDQIIQYFSMLERPLRKYSHTVFEHEEMVLGYLKDPISALSNDKDLKIAEALKNLEGMLNENKIQVDEKKKEKSFEAIKKMDMVFLKGFSDRYSSFKSEMKEIDHKIVSSGVADRLRQINDNLESANLRIERMNIEHGKISIDAEKTLSNIESLKKGIESSIKSVFDINLSIVMQI
mgnify:CR=1 FL=1